MKKTKLTPKKTRVLRYLSLEFLHLFYFFHKKQLAPKTLYKNNNTMILIF